MTAGEFKRYLAVLPSDAQTSFVQDPESFLKQWALMRKLTRIAEQEKLQEQSPAREKANYYRMLTLSEAAYLSVQNRVNISPAEGKTYYEAHRDQYKDVRVKAIRIDFSMDASGKRSEETAKALADKIETELRGSADFVKLVAQYSDDADSKAKGGDFTTVHGSDNIPQPILKAVMGLKQGQYSEPIRQPNAFYIFRAENVSYKTFEEVKDELLEQLRKDAVKQAMDKITNDAAVDFKSPALSGKPSDAKSSGVR